MKDETLWLHDRIEGLENSLNQANSRIDELEATMTAILPTLNEGAASGMVPFQECKDAYALACKTMGVEPEP